MYQCHSEKYGLVKPFTDGTVTEGYNCFNCEVNHNIKQPINEERITMKLAKFNVKKGHHLLTKFTDMGKPVPQKQKRALY